MKKQKQNTANGLTVYSMRVGQDASVRMVTGTMYKLLSAKSASILTRILSPRFVLRSLRQRLYGSRKNRRADNTRSSYPSTYGLIGLQAAYARRGLANSTTLPEYKPQKAQADMLRSICSNRQYSKIRGLPDGSELGILRPFPIVLKNPPTLLCCYLMPIGLRSPRRQSLWKSTL